MTYGGASGAPVRERRRVAPGTIALLVAVVVVGVLGVLALNRGLANVRALEASEASSAAANSTGPAGGEAGPTTPAGADATAVGSLPLGAQETAGRFTTAWLERDPELRAARLKPVTAPGLAELLTDVDPADIPRARPSGTPRAEAVSSYSATVVQQLSNGSGIRLELAADPEAEYGWLVYAVSSADDPSPGDPSGNGSAAGPSAGGSGGSASDGAGEDGDGPAGDASADSSPGSGG